MEFGSKHKFVYPYYPFPGVDNEEADHASRFFKDDAEIMLKP